VFPVLDGPVLKNGFFTGPVSATVDAPVRSVAEQHRSLRGP
jgi:hypothetical protein